MPELAVGSKFVDRFLIEKRTQTGGMGQIYRALDLHTDRMVALKLMRSSPRHEELTRFLREAQTLSELRHPRIVTYVAHGISREQLPYLAMEWLHGEDLGHLLRQRSLSLEEAMVLLHSVTDALTVAHRADIVHRDLKPSNLFLRDGQIERVTLIDFGLARRLHGGPDVTKTGSVIGTPEYMAPEQARGDRQVGPSADIFSLGCVLFECLTGQPPFCHEHLTAVMAKILFEDPPQISRLRPDLPPPLANLIQRMLVKNRLSRIADAMELKSELDTRQHFGSGSNLPRLSEKPSPQRPVIGTEQVLVSMVLAQQPRQNVHPACDTESTELRRHRLSCIRDELTQIGARAECLADGSVIATVSRQGAPTEQAIQAVRCALAIDHHYPGSLVGLATGRAVLSGDGAMGDVTSKLSQMLETVLRLPDAPHSAIVVDETTSRLVHEHFRLLPLTHRIQILEKTGRPRSEHSLALPETVTPYVGRERELGLLSGSFANCRDNSQSTVVLVTAPTGMGKSRLCSEFVRRISSTTPDRLLLCGRGEPIGSGSSYSLLGQALRQFMGLQDGEEATVQRDKIATVVGKYPIDTELQIVASFLGEICGTPFPENHILRSARRDPRIMADQTSSALVSFFGGLTRKHTVLLILEDLHWGDSQTCHLVEAALRELHDQRLMVLGLARPEIEELFPKLWIDRSRQDIRLGPLSRKACERLMEHVMGPIPPAHVVSRMIEQSAGNAFFLEELMRSVSEGRGEELPETVLAVLNARLMRLPSDARHVVRAASVFGDTFWEGGVRKLLGVDRQAERFSSWLQILVESEIISRHRESRIPGTTQYGFRHALVREAAYEMLTTEDRKAAHFQAGCYLESVGARDAALLAEHFERGGADSRAAIYYVRATEHAYDANSLDGVLRYAARGVVCGAAGEHLGALRALQAWVWFWRGDLPQAIVAGTEAIQLLTAGSAHWFRATAFATTCAAALGKRDLVSELSLLLGTIAPTSDCVGTYVESAVLVLTMLGMIGDRDTAERYLFHIDRTATDRAASDSYVRGWMHYGMGRHASALQPMPGTAVVHYRIALDSFREGGDRRMTAVTLGDLGLVVGRLGRTDDAETTFREGLAIALTLADVTTSVWIEMFYALSLAERTDPSSLREARRLAQGIVDRIGAQSYYSGFAACILSACDVAEGKMTEAEAASRRALAILKPLRSSAPIAYLSLGRTLLIAGRTAEAVEILAEGIALVDSLRGSGGSELPLRLLFCDALRSGGEMHRLRAAQRILTEQIAMRVVDIPSHELRDSYLERHSEANARKLLF